MVTKKTPGKKTPVEQADLFSSPIEMDVVEVDEAPVAISTATSSGGGSGNHDPKTIDLNEDGKDSLTLAVYAERCLLYTSPSPRD